MRTGGALHNPHVPDKPNGSRSQTATIITAGNVHPTSRSCLNQTGASMGVYSNAVPSGNAAWLGTCMGLYESLFGVDRRWRGLFGQDLKRTKSLDDLRS